MLFWLAEALRLPEADLAKAYDAVLAAGPNGASRCRALRQVFPWTKIEAALETTASGSLWSRFTK
jgi:hypothetical protein